ncbi:hypothetical protein [Pseudomonas sp.]|uniref:hypothetical protein n=1 Tax=Pseudomonas sp. TaxID=306 RepID=UPI00258BEF6D|nr:hypothetical protein [Pseudomonas sp.]
MPKSKAPRKKYRPRPLIQDPIAWAVSGVKTMHADRGTMLAKQVRNSDALTALCQGRATKSDMDVLIHMHNAVEALWQAGFGTEYSEILIRGKCALLEIGERGAASGRFVIKATERQALNDLVALYDAQMEVATVRDVYRADAKALYEIATRKAIVIKDLEKLRLAAQQEEDL